MIVLTGGKDASSAYCLTTALYCPLPGQYSAIARHKTIRRERKSPLSYLLFTLHQIGCPPINTGVPSGEEWRTTLHHSSPTLHLDIFSSDYAELTEHSCFTDYARNLNGFGLTAIGLAHSHSSFRGYRHDRQVEFPFKICE